jgi:hypothetical protein
LDRLERDRVKAGVNKALLDHAARSVNTDNAIAWSLNEAQKFSFYRRSASMIGKIEIVKADTST